jgi:hypothetical protein
VQANAKQEPSKSQARANQMETYWFFPTPKLPRKIKTAAWEGVRRHESGDLGKGVPPFKKISATTQTSAV